MRITFISDYVCPYCLVAKEALHQALKETGIEAQIVWQPFELTMEPAPRVDTWNDERRRANYKILEEPCKSLGLDMKLPPHIVPRPYTRLAFEGWHYACEKGRGEEYNDLVYRAYFIDEQDIGEISVLKALAARAGLDEDDFARALEAGEYTQRQREAAEYARNVLKPAGVPTLYINDEKVELSGYSREDMMCLLLQEELKTSAPAMRCGEDGCAAE